MKFSITSLERVGQSNKKLREALSVLFFIGPSLTILVSVLIFPIIGAIYLSFHSIEGQAINFVGISNYIEAISDPWTWRSFSITLRYTLISVIVSLGVGMLLALLLDKQTRGQRFFRTAFTLPWPIISVVVGMTFLWMFNPQFGMVNELLTKLGIIETYQTWLSDSQSALFVIILATVWKEAPFFMIMITAALQAIPTDQYEASAVDGADYFRQLIHITLPNLKRIIIISTMLQIIWRFRTFDLINIITEGGPNRATEVLSVQIYRYAFRFFRFGKAQAVAVLMVIVSLVFVTFYLRLLKDQEDYS